MKMVDQEVKEKIKENIKNYLLNKNGILKFSEIEVIREISGMSNKNYQVRVTIEKPPNQFYFFYRKYGVMSNCLNRGLEQTILEAMSKEKLGPELLYKGKDFCILEFIVDAPELNEDEKYNENILNHIINISVNYSFILHPVQYEILQSEDSNTKLENCFKLTKVNEDSQKNVTYSIANEVIRMLPIAQEKFDCFYNDIMEYYKDKSNIPEEEFKRIQKFEKTLKNYVPLFLNSFYYKKGFLVLSHNDMHRWNFLKKDEKIYIIDHEYACMSLIGMDLANYMNENSFYFAQNGNEVFKKEEIDINYYYKIYLKYLEKLKKKYDKVNPDLVKFLNEIKSIDYYISLHIVTNTFWFLFTAINLSFDKHNGKISAMLKYGCDRLEYVEIVKEYAKKIDNKNVSI